MDEHGVRREAEPATALAQALAGRPKGTAVDVIACNELAVHWLQDPPADVGSLAELKLVAAVRCAHLFGGTASSWWIAGNWDLSRPFACAALPSAQMVALQAIAQEHGATLRWHTAWGLLCSARAASLPGEGWSAARSRGRLVAWHCRGGRPDALWSVAAPPDAAADEDLALVRALARLEGAGIPAAHGADASSGDGADAFVSDIHLITLQRGFDTNQAGRSHDQLSEAATALALAPLLQNANTHPGSVIPAKAGIQSAARSAAALHSSGPMKPQKLVFDEPRRSTRVLLGAHSGGLARAGLAAALAASAALAVITWESQRLRNETQALSSAQPLPSAAPAPVPGKPLTAREIAAWNEAALQLNTPWPALLAALEQATPADVALVSIEPDARSRSVRLQAEAKALDALLAYAQALQGRAPIGAVMPARHETNDQDPNKPLRLSMQLMLAASPATGQGAQARPEEPR
jgi:hypothetical protein